MVSKEDYLKSLGKKWQRVKLRCCYTKETHYILNVLTLRIKDKDVQREYDLAREKNFEELFPKMFLIMTLYFLFRVA